MEKINNSSEMENVSGGTVKMSVNDMVFTVDTEDRAMGILKELAWNNFLNGDENKVTFENDNNENSSLTGTWKGVHKDDGKGRRNWSLVNESGQENKITDGFTDPKINAMSLEEYTKKYCK